MSRHKCHNTLIDLAAKMCIVLALIALQVYPLCMSPLTTD